MWVPVFGLMGAIKCLKVDMGVSCMWFGCVFVSGLEHYTFSPLSCLTVALPRQTRHLARCLVETTPVRLQTTSNNADSLCTCLSVSQSVSNFLKKLAAWISAKCLLSNSHTHTHLSCLSLSLINTLLNTVSFLPSVCWTALISALSKQTVKVYRMDSDTTSH